MEIADLITVDRVIANLRVANKKQALTELAKRAGPIIGFPDRQVLSVLSEREQLGSTGFGAGIAIPHGRLQGLAKIVGLFARLEQPIDFESIDERPVDLIFLLLSPEGAGTEHLKTLARVTRLLRDRPTSDKLRRTDTALGLYALLTDQDSGQQKTGVA
jgi:PTS system nitrogen regulatory IIA component